MSLYAIFFLLVVAIGWIASMLSAPIWGLITYIFVYFNIPSQQWWGDQVPDLRWSFLSAGVLVVSCLLHPDQLSKVRLTSVLPLKYLISLFLLMVIIALIAVSPTAIPRLYEYLRLVIIYILVIKIIANKEHLKYVIYMFLIQLTYLGYLAHHYFQGGRLDSVGTVDAGEANSFASLLVIGMPLIAYYLVRGKRLEKLCALAGLALTMNAFIMCRSRGGFLALAVTWVCTLFIFDARFRKKMLISTAGAGLMFVLLADPGYLNRLQSLENPLENSAGRWQVWHYGVEMVKDHPLGAGGEGFLYLSPFYMPDGILSQGVRAAHNTYLLVAVEQGIPGLLLYLGFLFYTCKGFRDAARNGMLNGALDRGLQAKFFLVSLAGILTASLFLDRLYSEVLYWICALSVVSYHLSSQEVEAEDFSPGAAESGDPLSWKSVVS